MQSALNAVFTAMFYLETSVKDLKLATPLGLCIDAKAVYEAAKAAEASTPTEASFLPLLRYQQHLSNDALQPKFGQGSLDRRAAQEMGSAIPARGCRPFHAPTAHGKP